MSIRSAILALNPAVYWPMDDLASAQAADASGNNHPGNILVDTATGAPGPEPGTFCFACSSNNAGVQITGTNPLTGTGPWTLLCWLSASSMPSSSHGLVYNGLGTSTGVGITLSGVTPIILVGGLGSLSTGIALSIGRWHMIAFVFIPAVSQTVYVDSSAGPFSALAATPNAVIGTNPLAAQNPNPGLLAHAAFWGVALTAPQLATVFAAGPVGAIAPSVSGRNATDADVLALETKLDTILSAVRKTY